MSDDNIEPKSANLPTRTDPQQSEYPLPDCPMAVTAWVPSRPQPRPCLEAANDNPDKLVVSRVLISINDFQTMFGLGKTTIWKLIREQRLEVCRIGSRTFITMRSAEALIEQSIQKEGL